MLICFASDTFGNFNQLFQKIETTKIHPDWIIHVGSLGVWPDPRRVDRATRKRGETDFHQYYLNTIPLPYKTLFVPGKHEDHKWIKSMYKKQYVELIPNLHYLPSGYIKNIHIEEDNLKVLGLGGIFSPKTYNDELSKNSFAHYTKQEVEKACSPGPIDLFISAETGYGIQFGNIKSQALGINNICFATRPKLHVHGHYNHSELYINPTTSLFSLSLSYGEIKFYEFTDYTFRPV